MKREKKSQRNKEKSERTKALKKVWEMKTKRNKKKQLNLEIRR